MKLRFLTLGIILTALLLGVTACEHKGPAERAGEKIDNAAEKAGDKMQERGDKVEDATDKK